MGLSLSASTIKSWFQYGCERKTRYELMDAVERASIPLIQDVREAKAWADFGMNYEKRVFDRLGRASKLLAPGAGEDGLSERMAFAFLRGDKGVDYAAQMNLKPRQSPALLRAAPNVRIKRTYADLIKRLDGESGPSFRLIDVKATRVATTFHKAQVAFYARMLEAVLRDAGLPGRIDPIGSIWRIPDDDDGRSDEWQEENFALTPYLRLVDDFCQRLLPVIAAKKVGAGQDETFFHIYFKCEQCDYLPHCARAIDPALAADRIDISAVPGLTYEAKRNLWAIGVRNVERLAEAAGLRKMDGAGWSLTRRGETLIGRAASIRAGQVARAAEAYTFLMPPRADVAFYFVVDSDPVDAGLVTLGYLKVANGMTSERILVLPTADRSAEADALVSIFGSLIAELEKIDEINRNAGVQASIYSHIFFYEPSEAINLQNAVRRHLDDPRVRDGLLHMVRLFPPDDVVPEPEFRGMHHLPATALRSVVEQLYAMPVVVAYDLRQVSGALVDRALISLAYRPEPPFQREFSSLLSIEVSREIRERRSGEVTIEAVENDVRARLNATRAIVEWLQSENQKLQASGEGPMLRLAKKPFRLHATFDPLQAGDLDLLRALELLESRSGLLDTMVRLAQPLRARRDARRCAANLQLIGTPRPITFGNEYLLEFDVPETSQDVDFSSNAFGLILTDDNPDIRLNPARWREAACYIDESSHTHPRSRLRVRMATAVYDGGPFMEMRLRAGQRDWCLDETFVDLNSERAAAFLTHLSQGGARAGS
jgi:hypothetical protein